VRGVVAGLVALVTTVVAARRRLRQVYDALTDRWDYTTPLPQPMHHTVAATVGGQLYVMGGEISNNGIAARGCFYVFGGEGNDADLRGVFDRSEVYDPRTDSWQSLEAIPTPVHGVTGAALLNGLIHLPSGGTTRGGSSGSIIHQMFRAVVDCGG
jgi:N-acetylneuraminic acid mutarotase